MTRKNLSERVDVLSATEVDVLLFDNLVTIVADYLHKQIKIDR